MKNTIRLIIAIAVVIAIVITVSVWLIVDRGPSAGSRGVQPAPQKYDTTGGQDMRPRWKSQEGTGHGAANN